MADCKHELKYLVGMADGIHCKKCGAVLQEVPAQETAANNNKPVEKPTKKGGQKNARK